MSRENIIGLLLIGAIFIGYSLFTAPTEEQRIEAQRIQDSIVVARQAEQERVTAGQAIVAADTIIPVAAPPQPIATPEGDSLHQATLKDQFAYFSNSATGEDRSLVIQSERARLSFSTKGGFIESVELRNYKTWQQDPLMLFFEENNVFDLKFYSNNRLIGTQGLYFTPYLNGEIVLDNDSIIVSETDSISLALRLYTDHHTPENPKYLEWVYLIKGNDYMVGLHLNTVGLQDVIAANSTLLNLSWGIDVPRQEKSRKNELAGTTVLFKFPGEDVEKLRETRDEVQNLTTRLNWVSFKQQFFSSVLIAQNNFLSGEVTTTSFEETNEAFLRRMTASLDIPYNSRENNHFPMSFYFGPNHFQTLKAYGLELESQINLGWAIMGWINRFVVIPVFNYLDGFNLNYGIIILILTIMLKIVLFPIAYKTYLSSARMKVLKPDIDALNEKFPKKEDTMKKQQAIMALYKKAGVNPMAGCIPMLLQLPILLALFHFFPASIELRQEGFLWADDLSSYDSILDLPFTIPFYGDHVSLFTLLMTISTIIYTHMNTQMMSTGTMMPGMKTMLYIMPVMLLGIFNSFASGLSYYYFLTNMLTFGQMYAFRLMINEDKIRHKIEENKKKPVKKSGWQQRLEDMAKQQQLQQKKKKK